MDLQLQDKTAFISGSTKGIGFATAIAMLKEGTSVIINGRTSESVNTALLKLREKFPEKKISGIVGDFGNKNQVTSILDQIHNVDIVVNNVGIYRPNSFFETKDEEWYEQFEINVMSGVRLSRHILPKMLEKNWGRILFVSSECATLVPPDLMAYSMTKTAMLSISRSLAELTKGTNVTVNSVVPGSTLSEGAESFLEEVAQKEDKTKEEVETNFFKTVRTNSLLQRFAKVEEVAHTITYLASPLASATNGAAIKIDGGSSGGIL